MSRSPRLRFDVPFRLRLGGVVVALLALLAGGLPTAAFAAAPAQQMLSSDGSSTTVADTAIRPMTLAGFTPGNIISDGVFFNSGSMSEGQIQSFLESKVTSCASGYTCLKNFRQTTTTREPTAMCGGRYVGAADELASRIIYKVAQACGINPQVLIVMLQKEQALVQHRDPSDWRYRIAMGQGCPDTAACDTRYYGFVNQVYGAASQMKRYANPPGTSNFFNWYAPGKTWNIGFNPNAACGSSPVYIQNQATANLYYYTPYQPSQAALAAGYGEAAGGCHAYGNRNFYNYFTDWFGSTQGETLQVLQVSGTDERYLVSGGARWRLGTSELAAQYTWISSVRNVSRTDINALQDRGAAGRAIRTTSGIVYVLDSGQRLRVQSATQVTDFGWDYGSLPVASDAQAARYPDAGYLQRVVRSDGRSWLIQSGARRQVVDLDLLPRFGIAAASTSTSRALIDDYVTSTPVIGPGIYRDATNAYRVWTDAGAYLLPQAASGSPIARGARELTADSLAFLTAPTTMPLRLAANGKSLVLLEDGWLEVAARDYPAVLPFESLPNGAAAGIPLAGRATGAHFIRERSSAQTYLVSGGTLQAVSAAEQAWATRTYGVGSRVWIALDGMISEGVTPEGIVRTPAGIAYLIDGARAYRFRDCAQVSAWGGDCASLQTITDAKLASYARAGVLEHLVRTPAGTIWLPQAGQVRQVLDPQVLARFGIPSASTPVAAITIADLPVGEPVLTAGVYSDGSTAFVAVTEGGTFTVGAGQVDGIIRQSARPLTPASLAKVAVDGTLPSRMLSDGRSFVLTREGWLEVSSSAYGGSALFTALPSRVWSGIVVAANEQRPHFVRDEATATEYLISGGAAQIVTGASERAIISSTYGVAPKVWALASGALSGVRVSYELFTKSGSGEVYLMDGSTRYRTSGCAAAADFGKTCAGIRTLTAVQLAATRDGGTLAPLIRSSNGSVWLPQGGAKREVPDPRILSVYGIGTASTSVSASVMSQLRLGPPVVSVGVYDDRAGDVRVVTGQGGAYSMGAPTRIGVSALERWNISPESVDLIAVQGDLPTRISTGTKSFVMTNEGWLSVDAASYVPLAFAALGARADEGIRSAGSESRPHFVRESSSAQVYLASGGLSPVADEGARAWIASTYGVPAKVWVVADGALR